MTTEANDVLRRLSSEARARLERLDAFEEIGSTNTWLLEQIAPPAGRFRVATAEHQTAGRGRQGKAWLSPPSSGLCLSAAYTFRDATRDLTGLTLAAGVGIAGALRRMGADVAVKWPNDLVLHDRKLGGILTETKSGAGTPTVVVGVGVNVELPASVRQAVAGWKNGVADLAEGVDRLPSRPELTALVIESLIETMVRFDSDGFEPFYAAWPAFDWLRGRAVAAEERSGHGLSGEACGVDEDGALLLKTSDGVRRVISGSVALAGHPAATA
jgi:BirA family transcriptional regulator, biotin operon repressor / biotin---[acetyl-CoA-carboxylase] ligase